MSGDDLLGRSCTYSDDVLEQTFTGTIIGTHVEEGFELVQVRFDTGLEFWINASHVTVES